MCNNERWLAVKAGDVQNSLRLQRRSATRFLNQPHENYSPAQSLHLCAMRSVSCNPAPDRAGPM